MSGCPSRARRSRLRRNRARCRGRSRAVRRGKNRAGCTGAPAPRGPADRHRCVAAIDHRLSLIGQVAATYLTLRSAEERILLAERSVASRRQGLRIAGRRLGAGIASTVDYDQAALLVTQAETEKAELERVRSQASNLLTLLVGGPIAEAPLPEGRAITDAGQFRDIDVGLPSDLLANRPDILAAKMELRAANADIGAARAAFFPNISLTGTFGWASTELGGLFEGPSESWSLGGALNIPIFDWGKRKANLGLSKARADELTAAHGRTVQEHIVKSPVRSPSVVPLPSRATRRSGPSPRS